MKYTPQPLYNAISGPRLFCVSYPDHVISGVKCIGYKEKSPKYLVGVQPEPCYIQNHVIKRFRCNVHVTSNLQTYKHASKIRFCHTDEIDNSWNFERQLTRLNPAMYYVSELFCLCEWASLIFFLHTRNFRFDYYRGWQPTSLQGYWNYLTGSHFDLNKANKLLN